MGIKKLKKSKAFIILQKKLVMNVKIWKIIIQQRKGEYNSAR